MSNLKGYLANKKPTENDKKHLLDKKTNHEFSTFGFARLIKPTLHKTKRSKFCQRANIYNLSINLQNGIHNRKL